MPKPTDKAIKSVVQDIYTKINEPFAKVFGLDFNEAQTKVSSLDLQMKPTAAQRKKTTRDYRKLYPLPTRKIMNH